MTSNAQTETLLQGDDSSHAWVDTGDDRAVEDEAPAPPPGVSGPQGRSGLAAKRRHRGTVLTMQVAIVGFVLAGWEWVPQIAAAQRLSHIFNPFFVSSPSRIADRLHTMLYGDAQMRAIVWTDVRQTTTAAVVGLVIGVVLGGVGGLIIGNSKLLSDVFRPFLIAVNAMPRIALIPIVAIVFGFGFTTDVINAVLVVLFVVFFNAFEGAISVPPQLLENARILGAGRYAIMRHVRYPYVVGWTLATLPVSAAFAILAVVTGEILVGNRGLGGLLTSAEITADSTLTFSVAFLLAVMGLALVLLADVIRRRALHWWGR
jgi:NitT/TauT family transport system permease protein